MGARGYGGCGLDCPSFANGGHEPHGFIEALAVLALRRGVGDHACSSLDVGGAIFQEHGSEGDAGVCKAIEAEIAHGAGIDAAFALLELIDDLHRADLWRAADGTGRESGTHD